MKSFYIRNTIISVLVAVCILNIACESNAAFVTASGCFTCDISSKGEKIAFAEVALVDSDIGRDDILANGFTDSDGCFELSGDGGDPFGGKPDIYVRISFRSKNKDLHIQRLATFGTNLLPTAFSNTKKFNDISGTVRFGTVNLRDSACRNYVMFQTAVLEFSSYFGSGPPFTTLNVLVDFVKFPAVLNKGLSKFGFYRSIFDDLPTRTPFALYNWVIVQGVYEMQWSVAKHEFGHAIRHTFDGDSGHFLEDVAKYIYFWPHDCTTIRNEGFAFNEGFADWNAYWKDPGSYKCNKHGADPFGTKANEGNVAAALFRV